MELNQPLPSDTTSLTQGLVPEIDFEAFMPLVITSLTVTAILTVLFLAYIVFNSVRHYKVEKATIEMHKDIRRMRELMEQGSLPATQRPPSQSTTAPPNPAEVLRPDQDRILAQLDSTPSRDT